MSARIAAADVEILVDRRVTNGDKDLGRHIEAKVQGRARPFFVDISPAWNDQWFCTCFRVEPGVDCTHIRAVKAAIA